MQFIRKCSKATPTPHPRHWFMCYITLITPLPRGWRKLDSVLVPGCPHQAAPLLGLKGSVGGSQTAGVVTITTSHTKWAACLMFTQLFLFPNDKDIQMSQSGVISPPKPALRPFFFHAMNSNFCFCHDFFLESEKSDNFRTASKGIS